MGADRLEFEGTVQKITTWKGGKGQFIDFVESSYYFWRWGVSDAKAGEKFKVMAERKTMGSSAATHQIITMVPEGERKQTVEDILPMQASALRAMAASTGKGVQGGIDSLPETTQKIDVDVALVNQAQAIRELQSAIGTMQARMDELETKVSQVETLAGNGGVV